MASVYLVLPWGLEYMQIFAEHPLSNLCLEAFTQTFSKYDV